MAEPRLLDTAFPTLTPDQMAGLSECHLCKRRHFHDGEALFRAGDRDPRFDVVISGHIDIVDELGDQPKVIATHGPGGFAGDVSLVSGRPAVVTAYARGDTDVYEVSPDALRQLLNHDPDLGDLILQAFIARRQLLRASGEFTGLRVVGSRTAQDTFRVRDFLSRNEQPFTWLDLDTDPTAKDLLQLFGLTEVDTPVVSCGRHVVMKNPKPRELAEAIGLRRMPERRVHDLVVVGAG